MRELKFRAWRNIDGKLRRYVFSPFAYEYPDPDEPVFHAESGVNDIRDFMPLADIIEQYTGLKDKNGKEIYEGDIIFDRKNKVRSKVVWNEGNLWFDNEAEPDEWGLSPYTEMLAQKTAKDFEIIGNIHENPELLEDKK